MDLLLRLLSSKRVVAAVAAIAVSLLQKKFPALDPDSAREVVLVLIAAIIGDSISPIDPVKRARQQAEAARVSQ